MVETDNQKQDQDSLQEQKSKLKIFRRKFYFAIKKRFDAKRYYSFKDIEALPFIARVVYGIRNSLVELGLLEIKKMKEDYKEKELDVIKSEKKGDKKQTVTDSELRKIKVISPTSLAKKLLGVMFVFIAFVTFSVYLIFIQAGSQTVSESEFLKTLLKVDEFDGGLVPYSKDNMNYKVFYSLVNVTYMNLTNLSYTVFLSKQPFKTNVFILELNPLVYHQYQESYLGFVNLLKQKLADSGIYPVMIELEDLEEISENSILIIPVNYIPIEFLENKGKLIKDLLSKDILIFYVGDSFDRAVKSDGKVVQTSMNSEYDTGIKMLKKGTPGYSNQESNLQKLSKLKLMSREYIVLGDQSSMKVLDNGLQMIVSETGLGGIIFFPVPLSVGWGSIEDSVDDVSQVLINLEYYSYYKKSKGNLTEEANIVLVDNLDYNLDSLYYAIIFQGITSTNTEYKKLLFHRTVTEHEGMLYFEPPQGYAFIVSNLISEIKPVLTLDFNEFTNELSDVYLHIYQGEKKLHTQKLQGGPFLVNLKIIGKQVDLPVPPGGYVIVASKDMEETKVIGKTYVMLDEPMVLPFIGIGDWAKGKFNFSIVSKTTNKLYPVDYVDIYYDSRYIGRVNGSSFDVSINEAATVGEHTFRFVFLPKDKQIEEKKRYSIELKLNYLKPYIWYEDPIYLVMLIGAFIFVFVSRLIRAPEEKMYYLTVPDFPLSKINKVKVKPEFILGLFQRANRKYGWEYMPLTIEELKKTIYDMDVKGKKLIINDYNLEIILSSLIEKGLIKRYRNYYCPSAWESNSLYDVKYLSVIRMIREKALSLAIKYELKLEPDKPNFTFVFSTKEVYLFVISEKSQTSFHMLPYLMREEVILVLGDLEDKNRFIESLYSDDVRYMDLKIAFLKKTLKIMTVDEVINYLSSYK
ncbi:MAG: hypothetical protein N3E37_01290 [Candidatus Micrarchaeota archaeon]|nr:hypothetical protein [Candidatus Micrarchaeota archaeon]